MSEKIGFIKLHRVIQDNHLYRAEPFTRMQAWIDMLLNANFKPSTVIIRGQKVHVGRGQLAMSTVKMADRWRWSRGRVIRHLNELETEQQIEQQKSNVTTLITIINYDFYQGGGTADSTAHGTADGQQNNSLNMFLNNNNNKNNTLSTRARVDPQPVKILVPDDFQPDEQTITRVRMSGATIDPGNPELMIKFIAYHQGTGKQSCNWQAEYVTWCLRENAFQKSNPPTKSGGAKTHSEYMQQLKDSMTDEPINPNGFAALLMKETKQ